MSADDEDSSGGRSWRRPNGIFLISELRGPIGDRVLDIQRRFDPKLAASGRPHITLIGSSGAGPIAAGTSVEQLRAALAPIAASTEPIPLTFGHPMRFMQTGIVVLPLDPHGPLRTLHERIKASGLSFGHPRFAFTPHATLSFYRTLSSAEQRELLSVRVREPLVVDHIRVSLTDDPMPPRTLLELPLRAEGQGPRAQGGSTSQSDTRAAT